MTNKLSFYGKNFPLPDSAMLSDLTKDLFVGIHCGGDAETKPSRFLVKPSHSGSCPGTEPMNLHFRCIYTYKFFVTDCVLGP